MDERAGLLRMLDANANRALEGARVVEDAARFALDDAAACARLRAVRHAIARAVAPFLPTALVFRAAGEADVGSAPASNLARPSLAEVVDANARRAAEALRAIEEVLKPLGGDARSVERARQDLYSAAKRVALQLRPRKAVTAAALRVYVVLGEQQCKLPWARVAEAVLDGGATALQLREKDLGGRELLSRARWLRDLCRERGVLFFVNDRVDVAALCGAGAHVGQEDVSPADARQLVPEAALGTSCQTVEHAAGAARSGVVDYVGVGPTFASATKPRGYALGVERAAEVARAARPLPAVAIAGLTCANVGEVLRAGAFVGVAASGCVVGAGDPRGATGELRARVDEALSAV